MSNIANTGLSLLGIGSFIAGTGVGLNYTTGSDVHKGLYQFTAIGLTPLAYLSSIRHIFTPGHITSEEKSHFFETEAGGANLAIAVIATVALAMDLDNKSFGLISLVYACYLLVAMLSWGFLLHDKKHKIIRLIFFAVTVGFLLYFAITGLQN